LDVRSIPRTTAIVVMGVSGCGKSTIGEALAGRLGFEFLEGDQLHSVGDVAQMASGHALNDAERAPWLTLVGETMARDRAGHPGVVAACSALKRSYRDILRQHVPEAFFAWLDASFDVVAARLIARPHSFMPSSLLPSQFEALEPLGADELGVRVDAARSTDQIVETIELALRAQG
jgi:carbohydrate kinase (thermoresistant glucokinase family)